MKLSEKSFPILGAIKDNYLTDRFKSFIEIQIHNPKEIDELMDYYRFFNNKELQINYISNSIHLKLLDTSNFIKAKELLKKSNKTTGLILLPQTIYPDFKNVPEYVEVDSNDYPINSILYSWLSYNDFDKIEEDYDIETEDEPYYEDNRELLIVPLYNDGTTIGSVRSLDMISNNEVYGLDYNSDDRCWYGKIHDYVMSFILFYNYTESETKIIDGINSGNPRRTKFNNEKYINDSVNRIEIIDSSYFTKIIRTEEFGVSGHFRLQRYGKGNSETKIIYVSEYKKRGYIREAKINNKNSR